MRTHLIGGPHSGLALWGGLYSERVVPLSGEPVFRPAHDGEACYARAVIATSPVEYRGLHLMVSDQVYEWEEPKKDG